LKHLTNDLLNIVVFLPLASRDEHTHPTEKARCVVLNATMFLYLMLKVVPLDEALHKCHCYVVSILAFSLKR
jgi:hypothetical protein